jgi:hypothetical protein
VSGPYVFWSVAVVGAESAARRVSGSGNYLWSTRRVWRARRTVSVRVWPSGLSTVVVQRGVRPCCTQLRVYGSLTWASCIARYTHNNIVPMTIYVVMYVNTRSAIPPPPPLKTKRPRFAQERRYSQLNKTILKVYDYTTR